MRSLKGTLLGTWLFGILAIAFPVLPSAVASPLPGPDVTIQWNNAGLQGLRNAKLGAPTASRALAIVHTCMYDAWAAYDEKAVGTQLRGALRRPAAKRTLANKEKAISYAAYRALSDVLPVDTESVYKPLMKQLGYDPNDNSTDIETPAGIGNVACAAVLEFRHHDRSNQLGDLVSEKEKSRREASATKEQVGVLKGAAAGPYSDWSDYRPINPPTAVPMHFPFVKPVNPNHWQPLTFTDATGNFVLQMFSSAYWCFVTPFSLAKGEELRSIVEPGPARYGTPEYQEQARELIDLSANLTDQQKMTAEYWSDAWDSTQLFGHWMQFAEFVSERDHHTLDDDVKMFFALSNAMFDSGIAAWDAKRAYDSERPLTAIAVLFNGKKIRAWGGPGKGTVDMDGSLWIPYQPATLPTPPWPEYVSAQSAYSAAAARIVELWTGSVRFGDSVMLAAGSSKIEPGVTPAKPVTLKWETFADAANEAGMSRRYGGIHFARADLSGRRLGRAVAEKVWTKAQAYFHAKSPAHSESRARRVVQSPSS